MVRNYVRKTSGPKYTVHDIEKAVNDKLSGKYTYKQVSEIYNVPIAVIFNRIKGRKTSINSMKNGRETVLSKECEKKIEGCLIARSRMGHPCDKTKVKFLVGEYVKQNNLLTPFKDSVPGDDWYYNFMKRHPSLSFKKPEQLQKLRKDARKPEIVYDFYEKLNNVYAQNDLFNKGKFIFNADESGFNTDPSRLRAIGEKGKALSRVSGGSGRESISVLACAAADGTFLPPFIVFKGVAVQPRWTSDKDFPGTMYSVSKNGWMEEPLFYNWIKTTFISHVQKLRSEDPKSINQVAVLLYDGHCSHMSLRIIDLAMENNIILIKFPSHLTDKLQPLDKCVFGPLKSAWEKELIAFGKKMMGKCVGRVTKGIFAELLGSLWSNHMKTENITSGFKSTGIYPFDPLMFPVSDFDPVDYRQYQEKLTESSTQTINNEMSSESTNSNSTQIDNGMPSKPSGSATQINNSMPLQPSCSTIQINNEMFLQPCCSSTQINSEIEKAIMPTDIISIFTNRLIQYKQSIPTVENERNSNIRLKTAKYGEVLTTLDVKQRLQEAESNKLAKLNVPKGPRGRPKKKRQASPFEENLIDEVHVPLSDSSDDEHCDGPLNTSINEIEYEPVVWASIKAGVFVLVDVIGGTRKKTHFKYVCCVQNVDDEDGDVLVQGFKREDHIGTVFKLNDNDVFTITPEMILSILPAPQMEIVGRKILYKFSGYITVNEKP